MIKLLPYVMILGLMTAIWGLGYSWPVVILGGIAPWVLAKIEMKLKI